ncbi:hypothetical protein F5Y11DRAFT_363789 [Daldinia sp. FL1419]|nr:hypothetical protein F5Y11DRAFT_363789 [Daldinia sp. FL1419]
MYLLPLFLAISPFVSATTYFLTVFAPNTEVDGALLNAAAQGFYAGISGPSTYCPQGVTCPDVQGSLVYAGLTGMAVAVPGGQAIYVAPSGQIEYTQAHSAYEPPGALTGGWFNKTVVSECDPARDVLDFLPVDGSSSGGIKICPQVEEYMAGTGASYRLYAGTAAFNLTDCINAIGLNMHGVAANYGCWQYT